MTTPGSEIDKHGCDQDQCQSAFSEGVIEGVLLRPLHQHRDSRGSLFETFRVDTLPEGIHPVMSYVSFTEPGMARGPHEHFCQTDILAFVGPGELKIYLWDNRPENAAYPKRMIFTAGQTNPLLVIIPPLVVHGYRNLSPTCPAMVVAYPTRLYRGSNRSEPVDEVRHEDAKDGFYQEFIER